MAYRPTYLFDAGGVEWLLTPAGEQLKVRRATDPDDELVAWRDGGQWVLLENDHAVIDRHELEALVAHFEEHPPPGCQDPWSTGTTARCDGCGVALPQLTAEELAAMPELQPATCEKCLAADDAHMRHLAHGGGR